jgi:hypothetical protein
MGGMFSAPKAPKVEEPRTVPMADEDELAAARRRRQAATRRRGGRQSTVLTEDRDTLG